MNDPNPYAVPTAPTDVPHARTDATTNWFERSFLIRCLLVTVASYSLLPILWVFSLTIRDLYRGIDATILDKAFWQQVFPSNVPTLFVLGTALAIGAIFWLARSHRTRWQS